MGHHHEKVDISQFEEQFQFTAAAKRPFIIALAVGLILTAIGIFTAMSAGGDAHGAEAAEHALNLANSGGEDGHGGGYSWVKRLKTNIWINNIYILGFSIIGLFFMAIQYISMSGWSSGLRRIPEAFASFLPVASVLLIGTFFWVNHDIFHWTHESLYDINSPDYDSIIAGKEGFLNTPFYIARMIIMLGGWCLFMFILRKQSALEDLHGGKKYYKRMIMFSAMFVVFFGVSNSISSWDWIMSIDTHWFSTMFGWYHFASWWVTGCAGIALTVIFLKEAGYLKIVREDHIHDYGKYIFAFSIFWTYIWFGQFLLIYYANIPEETIYFLERFNNPFYFKTLLAVLFINFPVPFLWLMTRNSKRKTQLVKIAAFIVLVGHFLDYYMMITPGVMKDHGTIGLLEIGLPIVYVSVFALWVGTMLTKRPLVTVKHPMIDECINHHC